MIEEDDKNNIDNDATPHGATPHGATPQEQPQQEQPLEAQPHEAHAPQESPQEQAQQEPVLEGRILESQAQNNERDEDSAKAEFIPMTGRIYATGKRKNAIARVWVEPGSGVIEVNKKKLDDYFKRFVLRIIVRHPLVVAESANQFDVFSTVRGGGLSGQAGAVRHGISRAMALRSLEFRRKLKAEGLLTRDSRVVERKKYGRRKARRRFQFSKR